MSDAIARGMAADAHKFLDVPLATYTHTTNKEVVVSAVDVDTDTFTSAGHGLANNDIVYFMLNIDAGVVYPVDKFPGGVAGGTGYYVINKADDTFQLSATSGGAAVNLTANANIDLTKWHLERFSAEVTISNLPNLRRLKLIVRGRVLRTSAGSYITPNSIGAGSSWIRNATTTFSYPDLALDGDIAMFSEIIYDTYGYLTMRSLGYKSHSNTSGGNTNAQVMLYNIKLDAINISITSLTTATFRMANGTVLEVYRA